MCSRSFVSILIAREMQDLSTILILSARRNVASGVRVRSNSPIIFLFEIELLTLNIRGL